MVKYEKQFTMGLMHWNMWRWNLANYYEMKHEVCENIQSLPATELWELNLNQVGHIAASGHAQIPDLPNVSTEDVDP